MCEKDIKTRGAPGLLDTILYTKKPKYKAYTGREGALLHTGHECRQAGSTCSESQCVMMQRKGLRPSWQFTSP